MAPIALAFAVIHLGGSPTDLGLVVAVGVAPQVIFMLVGGVIADRVPKNQVMVWANVASAVTQGIAAWLLLTGRAEIWHLGVISLARGTFSALFFPASSGIVPQTVPRGLLQPANGLLRLGINATNIGGAAAGGLLVGLAGPGWAIAVDAISYLAAGIILGAMRVGVFERTEASSFVTDLRLGWQAFAARRWLWAVVIGFSLGMAAESGAMSVLGPIVAETSLGGATAWGVVLAFQGVGLLIGGLIALRVRARRPLLFGVTAMLALPLPIVLLAVEAPVAAIAGGALLLGIGIEVFSVNWDLSVQGHVPEDLLARVYAWDAVGSICLMPVGLAVVGPIADQLGVTATLWTCAALALVAMAAQLLVRDVRVLGRPDLEPTGTSG
jgi:predicted MFS family arabinose efflux permease